LDQQGNAAVGVRTTTQFVSNIDYPAIKFTDPIASYSHDHVADVDSRGLGGCTRIDLLHQSTNVQVPNVNA
jgi:hypothetical protein